MSAPIRATIQTIEGDTLTLSLEDGQTLRLPVSAVEGAPKTGMDVFLIASVPGSEDAARQAVSKHLLNELLGKDGEQI